MDLQNKSSTLPYTQPQQQIKPQVTNLSVKVQFICISDSKIIITNNKFSSKHQNQQRYGRDGPSDFLFATHKKSSSAGENELLQRPMLGGPVCCQARSAADHAASPSANPHERGARAMRTPRTPAQSAAALSVPCAKLWHARSRQYSHIRFWQSVSLGRRRRSTSGGLRCRHGVLTPCRYRHSASHGSRVARSRAGLRHSSCRVWALIVRPTHTHAHARLARRHEIGR
jgi:hypothetical protein